MTDRNRNQRGGRIGEARWALVVILALAAGVRLWGLDHLPPPLNQDEASRGYDAWALLETGADRHGEPWPFFLRSFGPGDYTAALSTYLTMPFVAMLGPTPTAMRLPSALLSICTVALLYIWVRRRLSEPAALAAAAIMALDPWHVGLTRTAHEAGFAPVFLLLGLLGLDRAGLLSDDDSPAPDFGEPGRSGRFESPDPHRDRLLAANIGGLSLAMHAWVYPATRLFTPLLLLAVVVIYRGRLARMVRSRNERLVALVALGAMVVGAAPLWMTAVRHPDQLAARAEIVLISADDGPVEWLRSAVVNYASNLSPRDWFLQSEDMSGVAIPGVGRHLLLTAPLFVLGLMLLIHRRRESWAKLLLAWFVLFAIPAAICRDWNPHPMRTVAGIALYPIICAIAIDALTRRLDARSSGRTWRGWAVLGVVLLLGNAGWTAPRYVRALSSLGAIGYQTALADAVRYATREAEPADFVLVTNRCIQPYIYVLLERPIAPTELRGLERVAVPGRLRFDEMIQIGPYYFAPKDPADPVEAAAAFQEVWSQVASDAKGLIISRCEEGGVGRPLATFRAGPAEGEDCFSVWEASKSAISP